MSEAVVEPTGGAGVVHDWSRDKQVFGVPWGKAMMWIFLLSDTFIFSCFLVGYMMVRISTTDPWPNPSEVFGLEVFGQSVPLLLIAIMAVLGATFVGMQAFEWTKLISEGVRPWENPFGAAQFGSSFFMITGFHGMHVSAGVIYLLVVAFRVRNGYYEKRGGNYDLVWVFIFAFFYLW
jgi:cytochrome c oxidase subunit 3